MTVPEPIYYEHKPDKNLVKLQQRQRQEQQDNFNANNDLSLLISTLDQELSGVVNDGANSQFINDQISSVAVRPGFKVKQMESSASLDYTGIIMTNAINCSNSAAASGSNTESGSIMDFNQPLLHAHSMSAAVLPALETPASDQLASILLSAAECNQSPGMRAQLPHSQDILAAVDGIRRFRQLKPGHLSPKSLPASRSASVMSTSPSTVADLQSILPGYYSTESLEVALKEQQQLPIHFPKSVILNRQMPIDPIDDRHHTPPSTAENSDAEINGGSGGNSSPMNEALTDGAADENSGNDAEDSDYDPTYSNGRGRSSFSATAGGGGASRRSNGRLTRVQTKVVGISQDNTVLIDHNGEFRCHWPGCSKNFSRIYNLKSHMKTHTGEKPFKCPDCELTFGRNHDLKRHIRVHSGNRPFVCPGCKKSFTRLDALNRHAGNSCRAKYSSAAVGKQGTEGRLLMDIVGSSSESGTRDSSPVPLLSALASIADDFTTTMENIPPNSRQAI